MLHGLGERLRLAPRGGETGNGARAANGSAKTPAAADAKPSRTA